MTHIEEVLQKYRNNQIDINEALEESIPLIRHVLHQSFKRGKDEDLIQESLIIMVDCFNDFSEEKDNCKFTTYVCNLIKWRIARKIWEGSVIRKPCYLYDKDIDRDVIRVNSSNVSVKSKGRNMEINILDLVSNNSHLHTKGLNPIIIKELTSDIKPIHLDLINMWLEGYTFKEMGDKYNKTHGWAELWIKKSIKDMRNKAVKKGYIKAEEEKITVKISDPRVVADVRNKNGTKEEIAKRYGLKLSQIKNLESRIRRGEKC